ncbi:NACHT, LRR and PYD domains-containing protein 12-like [Clupea harengus]|uniref:NACHT, LRR and PYD domains-containing protein 12-like n=1 Tax=Clupea harengus TaxID=7950 RepID=A0A6P8F937_CLUHA|nr:NACHT, LRR and PYD domains-containing protein 12-like [Clupea harengus]
MSQKPDHSVAQGSGAAGPQDKAGLTVNANANASHGGIINAPVICGNKIEGDLIQNFNSGPPLPSFKEFQEKLKDSLRRKYKDVHDSATQERRVPLSDIYTDLDITIPKSDQVIKCTDIFKQDKVRTVLTKGISGTGKTISVQKFIMDWVDGKSNQDVDFIFTIPFKDLNSKRKETHSLLDLVGDFVNGIHVLFLDPKYKTVIILDGLHEYHWSSSHWKSELFCNIEKKASVDVLLTNLVRGDLLDGALLWITSQPAAAAHLPPELVDMVTELKGFNEQQKEEYFRKVHKGSDGKADKIISYMNESTTLRVLCDIPAFCRMLSIVLKDTKKTFSSWTQLLANYLCHHVQQLDESLAEKVTLKLGKLAWQMIEKGEELDFEPKDLKDCGLDADEHAVFSGICTENFEQQNDNPLLNSGVRKIRFFNPCFQQILAAVYVILSFVLNKKNPIKHTTTTLKWTAKPTMFNVHMSAVERAIKNKNKNRNLDLFVRFLLGLSEKSNRSFVEEFLKLLDNSQDAPLKWEDDNKKTVDYITKRLRGASQECKIKLFEFLKELNDESLPEKISEVIQRRSSEVLDQNLIILLQTNKEIQEEFDMKKYQSNSESDVKQLLRVVCVSNRAKLNRCNLTKESFSPLGRSLMNPHSQVKDLDLSENELGKLEDSGMNMISGVLQGSGSKIEILSLFCCGLESGACKSLSQALQAQKRSRLRELDLGDNDLGDQGVAFLCSALAHENCKLQTLRLAHCRLKARSCKKLISSLQSAESSLKHLDMCCNDLQDSGVEHLSVGVTKLETLRLASCKLTEKCGEYIGKLLQCPTLKELDLTGNHLKDAGVKEFFSKGLASPDCKLEKLILKKCDIRLQDPSCYEVVSSAIKSETCPLRELDLSLNPLQDSGAKALIPAVVNLPCKIESLSLACCTLTEETCKLISTELKAECLESSCLREIDLSDNDLMCAGVIALCKTLENADCKWEKLCLSLCSIKGDGCEALAKALTENPSHLKHLDLRFNHPGENRDKMLKLKDSTALGELRMEHGREIRLGKGQDRYECELTLNQKSAHPRLYLKKGKIRWGEWDIPSPPHPNTFESQTQVLCEEPLSGRCYWEVKWNGLVSIGVAYIRIARKGEGDDCILGRNSCSWSLDCSDYEYLAWHNKTKTAVALKPAGCHRVGVYLDWLAGTLTFFKVKIVSKKREFTLLHTFEHRFSLPLYAGFKIKCDSYVFICPQGEKPA